MSDYFRDQKGTNETNRPENAGASFLDPMQLGAQMQQGGVQLPEQGDFVLQGDDAPTRVARPVVIPQAASKQPAPEKPAAEGEAPVRRRRSRVSERAQAEPAEAAQPVQPTAQPEVDPFQAGDSEEPARQQTPVQPMRRPVPPQVNAEGLPVRRPVQPAQRPAPSGQRPLQPLQPAQRPAAPQQLGSDGQPMRRPVPRQLPPEMQGERPQRPVPAAEPVSPKKQPKKKGGALLPLLLALVIVVGLLLGLCLPDWKQIGGPVGEFLAPAQEKVMGVVHLVLPEKEALKGFSATAAGSVAPTQVLFTVQTAKDVEAIRIVDDFGVEVYSAAYAAALEDGRVIVNSDALMWTPACDVTEGYSGGYYVYATRKGEELPEGMLCALPVDIESPKESVPAMQAFACDTAISELPVQIVFTATTSDAVTAVRVVDDSNNEIISAYADDEISEWTGMIEENGLRLWTLITEITSPYTGSYTAQYQTDDDFHFSRSDYSVAVQLGNEPAAVIATPTPFATPTPLPATPTPEPTPSPTPTATPIPSPSPTPEPTPTPVPTTSPLPVLSAAASEDASPEALKTKVTRYTNGKTVENYNRSNAINLLNAFTTTVGGSDYANWRQAGVLTFRSGPLRQNAAYSTVEVEKEELSLVWSQPIGSMRTSETELYGVAAPGQPVIVKWPTELRKKMGLYDAAKEVVALKEAIIAGQDGKVHFFNLLTGEATRDAIDIGAPSRGGLSVATNGTPILGVGQYNAKLAKKTVKNGYHVLNLVTNSKEMLIAGDGKDKNSNYSGVTGAALFDSATGTMIVGAQNGVLYTAELGTLKDSYNYGLNEVSLSNALQGYKTLTGEQRKTSTNIDASVAMYNNYVYFGDQAGYVQCVDVNTLSPVWVVETEDNIDSTPALDVEDGEKVALYTGNTVTNRTKSSATAVIRRIDALTGEVAWAYEVPGLTVVKKQDIGCYASPVVGQESISDLVIYTVSNGREPAKVIALNKADGSLVWETMLESPSISSPVAVYNEAGDAWLIQADQKARVHLMNAKTGAILNTLQLEPIENPEASIELEASPAVYGNLVVIGTNGKDAGGVYCIKID